jgi:hypothetical protein
VTIPVLPRFPELTLAAQRADLFTTGGRPLAIRQISTTSSDCTDPLSGVVLRYGDVL